MDSYKFKKIFLIDHFLIVGWEYELAIVSRFLTKREGVKRVFATHPKIRDKGIARFFVQRNLFKQFSPFTKFAFFCYQINFIKTKFFLPALIPFKIIHE